MAPITKIQDQDIPEAQTSEMPIETVSQGDAMGKGKAKDELTPEARAEAWPHGGECMQDNSSLFFCSLTTGDVVHFLGSALHDCFLRDPP